MRAVKTISGTALPLDRRDVDTDQIIPSDWLKRTQRTGYGVGLFSEWRKDPKFVLNDARFSGAVILIAGTNFGCGSSREHAAWAIDEYGFRAVIAPTFADIFRNNSLKIGLVPVELPEPVVERLLASVAALPSTEITIDIQARSVTVGKEVYPFPLDDFSQWRLLEGLDDIGLTERHEEAIVAYEARRAAHLPTIS